MDIEEMKKRFDALNTSLESLDDDNIRLIRQVEDGKIKSAQTKLCGKYRVFVIIGLTMSIVMPVFYRHIFPLAQCIGFSIFFLIAAMMDLYLLCGVRKINYTTMGVETVARKALFYRKRHHLFMAILIALCIPLIGSLYWVFRDDTELIYGMITGGIIGLAIGVRAYITMMREYRAMYK